MRHQQEPLPARDAEALEAAMTPDEAAIAAIAGDDVWVALRHGGRLADKWRVAYRGDESSARKAFEDIGVALRQGAVKLYGPDGICADTRSGPRLLRRW